VTRDSLEVSGWPVTAARKTSDGNAAPSLTPVTHSYAALTFYTRGGARVEQNGEWTLGEGDILLVPAGEPHRMLARPAAEYWGMSVCVPCFAAEGAASILDPFERVRDGAAAVVHVPSARQDYLELLFRELADCGHGPRATSAGAEAVRKSLLTLVLAEVARAAGPSEPARATAGGVVVNALRFIERNCLRRLTLTEVAAAVGRTPTYVTSALTQATGRSAGEWIVAGRMGEARRLLLHSDEQIDIIAERIGYADSTHFIRMFRREHGITPAAWRAAHSRGS
jgi:AraC family transcriptional regulator, transcriptional activator of pobA